MIKKISAFFLLNGVVLAQATSDEIKEVLSKNAYEPNYFSMLLGLFLVIGLIYATGFLYQKMIKFNISQDDIQINKPQVISTTSLGQGRNLHVVKVGNSACLLGSTQNNITFIKDIELSEQSNKENVTNDKNG